MKITMLTILVTMLSSLPAVSAERQIVFIPGAHFGAGIYGPLAKTLRKFKAHLLEVKPRHPLTSQTMSDYGNIVCAQLEKLPGKVTLIGHSFGGAILNQALGICPNKVASLVYISAAIPLPGESSFSLFTAEDDKYYDQVVRKNTGTGSFEILDLARFIDVFAQDANPVGERPLVAKYSKNEAFGPMDDVIMFDLKKLQSTPKLVILTQQDRVVTLQTQSKYASRISNTQIRRLDSGHLPMVTKAAELGVLIEGFLSK